MLDLLFQRFLSSLPFAVKKKIIRVVRIAITFCYVGTKPGIVGRFCFRLCYSAANIFRAETSSPAPAVSL